MAAKPRLALALLLYTGGRRADLVAYGPQHIREGSLTYTQNKNRNNNPIMLTLPVLPDLAAIIAATKIEHMNLIVSDYGKPYTIEGFGKRSRKWAKAADLPHCTPHGLQVYRKRRNDKRNEGDIRLARHQTSRTLYAENLKKGSRSNRPKKARCAKQSGNKCDPLFAEVRRTWANIDKKTLKNLGRPDPDGG